MKTKKQTTLYLVQSAIIAALYVAVNYSQELFLPFISTVGPVQFRLSELLCTLAVFTPAAIPGLTVGCLLSNIVSVGVLPLDMVLGTMATFLAAVCAYRLRSLTLRGLPLLSLSMPVIFNAVIIGLELEIFFIEGAFTLTGFCLQAGLVALGEFGVCLVLGIPFYFILKKLPVFRN
ncbi:MAG: QueT transporter family protein [Ruminococcus sp.]|nr:QueT transporter family protein [Ruminococcus sp.]